MMLGSSGRLAADRGDSMSRAMSKLALQAGVLAGTQAGELLVFPLPRPLLPS